MRDVSRTPIYAAILLSTLSGGVIPLDAQLNSLNPTIAKVVESVSEDRMAANLKKLESFETRNIFSSDTDPSRGIGAARRWIFAEFKSYSPRLQVSFDSYKVKKKARIVRDVEIHNVVAVLPGRMNPDHRVIVSGHYDTMIFSRPEGESAAPPPSGDAAGFDVSASERSAPGVNDDGSGTAAVMELARVMSQYEWDNTMVFVAFTGEEEGLVGSTLYARKARDEKQIVDAVLNNDIIGSEVAGDGRINNTSVSLYSEDPADSPSRELARYVKRIGERYFPAMQVDLIFRQDRFGRGGDHMPFNQEGYAAVRLTSPSENFANQHSRTDTLANMSVPYATRVVKVNAAALACLALAPKAPVVMEEITRGSRKGQLAPMISRGKTRYDALLRWKNEKPEPDLAGYSVLVRPTTAPYWEKEIFVGKVNEYLIKDVSIDERIFGVKAIDRDGNESLSSVYTTRPRPKLEVETY